jgi:lipoprotein-anchoring transpeptidase ErfK/SrfK
LRPSPLPQPARIRAAESRSSNTLHQPVQTLLRVSSRMRYGQFLWDDKNVPPGKGWAVIDLDSQVMSVFRGGHEIGTAVILYGADSYPTPLGRFPVLAKMKDHRSSLYDAPMPYTLRLTNDGVSIHGSDVVRGAATHGCIGIPEAFAARVFEALQKGDEVTIVRSRKAFST